MSKFDNVRKKVKKKKNELHLGYIILFVILFIGSYCYHKYTNDNYEKKLNNLIDNYQSKSMTLGETLFATIKTNNEYRDYFNSLPFGNPLDTIIVNSTYGWRLHPVDSGYVYHKGIDLYANTGENIYSTGIGKVVFSGWKLGYGSLIIIEHTLNYSSLYAHLNKRMVVMGDSVKKGEIIALSGRSGKVSGPHLHYEIRINGKTVNPFEYLKSTNKFSEY